MVPEGERVVSEVAGFRVTVECVVPTGLAFEFTHLPALPCRAFTCRRFAAGFGMQRAYWSRIEFFFRPLRGFLDSTVIPHGLRRGLHSCAASRLGSR